MRLDLFGSFDMIMSCDKVNKLIVWDWLSGFGWKWFEDFEIVGWFDDFLSCLLRLDSIGSFDKII